MKASLSYYNLIVGFIVGACNSTTVSGQYDGKAFQKSQIIPGRVRCEYYDLGGEGITYHDKDSSNSGSGNLNKGTDSLSIFRINEAVDISFTKFHDQIDNSPYSIVQPEENHLYLGWTEPGEWTKYTVEVKSSGVYQLSIMYTAYDDGQIGLAIDDSEELVKINIPSTYNAADTIKWRQWHHWNFLVEAGEITLEKGTHILALHTLIKGHMNYDFIDFKLK